MDAEVAAQIGAQRGERNPERVTHRNGYRSRPWDTRVGTIELRIPKIREGSYFPSLLEPRRRSEWALLSVIQHAYAEGVSTRRVDGLTNAIGCDGIYQKVRCLAWSHCPRPAWQRYQVVENFRADPWTAVLIPMCGWTRDSRGFEKVVALSTSAR